MPLHPYRHASYLCDSPLLYCFVLWIQSEIFFSLLTAVCCLVEKGERWDGREGGREKMRSGVRTREREKARMGMKETRMQQYKTSFHGIQMLFLKKTWFQATIIDTQKRKHLLYVYVRVRVCLCVRVCDMAVGEILYVIICVHVYTYTRIHSHSHTHSHVFTHTRTHTRTHILYIYSYVFRSWSYVCIRRCQDRFMSMYIYTHVRMWTGFPNSKCVYVCETLPILT